MPLKIVFSSPKQKTLPVSWSDRLFLDFLSVLYCTVHSYVNSVLPDIVGTAKCQSIVVCVCVWVCVGVCGCVCVCVCEVISVSPEKSFDLNLRNRYKQYNRKRRANEVSK